MTTNEMHSSAETEPLLAHATDRLKSKKLLIFIVCGIFILSSDFGFYMSNAPQLAVFQDIICRNYKATLHRAGDVLAPGSPSDLNPCKSEAVQGELALVIGYKETLEALPGLVLALPYGVLSDRYGRKPILCLGILGIVLGELWVRVVCLWANVIPLRMVWLSALFRTIGGGEQVMTSVALVMVADVFSEDERSTILFRLQSCVIIAEILATPLSAYLMTFGPMYPYILSIGIVIVGSLLALFLPETLEDAKAKQVNQAEPQTEPENLHSGKRTMLQELTRQVHEFASSTRFIWSDLNICMVIVVLFVTVMSRQCTNILLQYVSTKFDWSISRSSLLISLRGIFSLVTYLVLMPSVSFIAAKYFNIHGKRSDHVMSKGSGILSVIGFITVSIAPTPAILIAGQVILSIGTAFAVTMRSLATSLVLPDHVGTLYSAIAIVQGLGVLISGPLFANLFRLGMHLGNAWLGLPFLLAALFFVIAVAVVWNIKLEPLRGNNEEQEALLS